MNFKTRRAAKVLNNGGVISIPTDTIQGLTCLPRFESSMQRLIDIKRRSSLKGMILLASDATYFAKYVANPALLNKITCNPGQPTTYLLRANTQTSNLLLGGFDTVAVRLTDNPLISSLCAQTQSALVSTSANISGLQVIDSALKLRVYFHDQLDMIVPPTKGDNTPSIIINLQTGERIR